jgi:hypothetical protein
LPRLYTTHPFTLIEISRDKCVAKQLKLIEKKREDDTFKIEGLRSLEKNLNRAQIPL